MFPWLSFLTYAVITAVTPGPNNIMSMSNGSRKGFRGAMPFTFGIWVGFTAVMLLCTAFCGALSALIPKIKLPMLVLGALYMLYLAWETFRSSGVEEDHSRDGFLAGLLLQFVNPKIYIYCIMSMEAYILPYYHTEPLPLVGFALLADSRPYCCSLPCCWPSSGLYSPWPGRPSGRCSAFCSPGTPGR